MSETFYWHDYETWGANPFRDRPSQFAGVRTDSDFNVIGEPLVQYCRPADDFLPSPEACLVTGITPQKALAEGYSEAEFIARIHAEMSLAGTCTVGYNNIRFDDEITRHTLYRNFFDPYAREWQNGNSRWDLIDVVRLAYALRPEGIVWPESDEGQVSFRLELLTAANNIEHTAAHDAMSDVYATIAIARLLREKQRRLYDYAFTHRNKKSLATLIDIPAKKPLFHVSSKYPAHWGCSAVVVPLARHPVNPNGIIVCDLRADPASWLNLSPEEIKARVFVARDQLREGEERIPLKVVHLNKCPILVETSILRTTDPARLEQFQLKGDLLRKHLHQFREAGNIESKVAEVFAPAEAADGVPNDLTDSHSESVHDPDTMLYSGGFFSDSDRQKTDYLRLQNPDALAETDLHFDDSRIPEMLFRYRARNYPDSLNESEMERWEKFRYQQLTREDDGVLSFQKYFDTIQGLAGNPELSAKQRSVLEELQMYGESIIPYI